VPATCPESFASETTHTKGDPVTTNTLPDVDTLATEFSIIIREWLTPDQCRQIDARNAAETDSQVCHSHDFCDANQAMIDAFARFNVECDPTDDLHYNLCQAAWAVAKRIGFGAK
jgi:hypothetical protein